MVKILIDGLNNGVQDVVFSRFRSPERTGGAYRVQEIFWTRIIWLICDAEVVTRRSFLQNDETSLRDTSRYLRSCSFIQGNSSGSSGVFKRLSI